jgi:hypothetical protein
MSIKKYKQDDVEITFDECNKDDFIDGDFIITKPHKNIINVFFKTYEKYLNNWDGGVFMYWNEEGDIQRTKGYFKLNVRADVEYKVGNRVYRDKFDWDIKILPLKHSYLVSFINPELTYLSNYLNE